MLDNSTVIIVRGTGKKAIPAPEMQAFSERFNFRFVAHEKGDANRSARVEGPFYHVERNFYPGRTFNSLEDANIQLLAWCENYNASFNRSFQASPRELFRTEACHMKPLPPHIPEVYTEHRRLVSTEGYIWLHTNRYSVPFELIGQSMTVRETLSEVRIYRGHVLLATHPRLLEGARTRNTLPEHRDRRRWLKVGSETQCPEELLLCREAPELAQMVELLKRKHPGRALRSIRGLHRLYMDYPTQPLCQALARALHYGLCDLTRLEKMVIRQLAGDYFKLPARTTGTDTEEEPDGQR